MEKIVVALKKKSYPIIIVNDILQYSSYFYTLLKKNDMAVFVTDTYVATIYLDIFKNFLNKIGVITDEVILPAGESNKSLIVLNTIFTKLLSKNYDRNIILIALGGGVIGDLTGFAAATYQRGVRFIQIPTTLLAQVDASIGGKTGVNHILGKNMIGSFYQPISVIIDVGVLRTLTTKEFSTGLSEVIKYAIAFDAVFFNWLEDNLDDLLILNIQSLIYCIRRCCVLKASIVMKDEFDVTGLRNLLNLGHTYAHAIESHTEYNNVWTHGKAVSSGIMIAVCTALRLGVFKNIEDARRINRLLKRANLPVWGPENMLPEEYLSYMIRDKKSRLNQINLVLPITIGRVKSFVNVDHDTILMSIQDSYSKQIYV